MACQSTSVLENKQESQFLINLTVTSRFFFILVVLFFVGFFFSSSLKALHKLVADGVLKLILFFRENKG